MSKAAKKKQVLTEYGEAMLVSHRIDNIFRLFWVAGISLAAFVWRLITVPSVAEGVVNIGVLLFLMSFGYFVGVTVEKHIGVLKAFHHGRLWKEAD